MGAMVSVCKHTPEDAAQCRPCSFVPDVGKGSWTTIYCTASYIEGDQVRIVHAYNRLTICEIEIFGMQIGNSCKFQNHVFFRD